MRVQPTQHLQAKSGTGGGNPLASHSLLSQGSRGAEVTDLQNKLKKAGFEVGQPGVFDAKTDAAVRQYQKANGLQVDGQVGQQTWGSFYGQSNPPGTEMLGRASAPTGAPAPMGPGGRPAGVPGSRDTFESGPVQGPSGGSNSAKLQWAMETARKMGLTITSTTGGKHAPGSYHYQSRAIDVAGSPSQMAAYYDVMRRQNPTELFYDPRGGVKHGRDIGAIGGHGDHVHVAF
jgi:hypothetical protein